MFTSIVTSKNHASFIVLFMCLHVSTTCKHQLHVHSLIGSLKTQMVYIPRYLFQKANLIKISYRVIHVDMFVTDNFAARKGLNGAQDHAIAQIVMNNDVEKSNDDVQLSIDLDGNEMTGKNAMYLAHDLTQEQKRTADVLGENVSNGNCANSRNIHFVDLQLSTPVLHGLHDAGFIRPSPIQVKAIPLGRLGMDLIVQAKSGTGKTVVFAVVILEAINVKRPTIQAIVLSPTREIAFQSQMVIERLASHIPGLKCHLFVGGLPLADDLRHLSNCHIVVGTPGRVRYLLEAGYLSTEHVRQFVLDEADLLLSGGTDAKLTGGSANNAFPADINYIWWSLPQSKQVLALSATYTDYLVNEHLPRYMNDPAIIRLAVKDPALIGVRQFFHLIQPTTRAPISVFDAKIKFLCKLLNATEFQQCLIFSNFHNNAQDLCDALCSRGWPVSYISSSLEQRERFRAFNKLRTFQCRVLITTDLTSRGIDAENVNLVISLEVPWEHETYVHRVGRAGRFGSYGASVVIVSDVGDECDLLKKLQANCPTQIRELPDPIPSDLATPNCSIELDNLVTVTNRMNNIQPRSVMKTTTPKIKKNQINNTNESKLHNNSIQSSNELTSLLFKQNEENMEKKKLISTNLSNSKKKQMKSITNNNHYQSINDQNALIVQLSKYMDIIESEIDSVSPLGTTITWENKSAQNVDEIEKILPNLLTSYHKNGMQNSTNSEISKDANSVDNQFINNSKANQHLNRHDHHESDISYTTPDDDSNHDDAVNDKNIKPKNFTSYFKKYSPTTNDIHWTSRQISAWYEYHKLVDYANYFYNEWYSAMKEYDQAVAHLNQLRQLQHCTD
uniref:RNA helicase n=2 Tax=Schistosoma haematobium TaxID=6185 RepID=A0A094ZSE4_SCHHA